MPQVYIASAPGRDKCVWNHRCTQINTDENQHSTVSFRDLIAYMKEWIDRVGTPRKPPSCILLSVFLLLSVFICVHPWFQGVVHAAGGRTLTGIDVLEAQKFAPLAGKRVGLITNQTGVDRNGRSTIDLLFHAPGVKLVALFSPEHGIRGNVDERIGSSTDSATGLPIYSLYGETLRPTDAMLAGVDTLVFDIQDAGVRFYTYITTMGYAMEAAAAHHIAFYVLDRPDPLNGERVEGPMLDRDRVSFVGYFPMPVRMGMTLGEMAQMFNAENKIGCDLHVVRMRNWRRAMWFDETGLPWVNPSPNLRSFRGEILYPALEILQAGGVSVGRGTDRPFERVGAPWIPRKEFVDEMNHRSLPGVRFLADEFTPATGPLAGVPCEGARVQVTDRTAFEPLLTGIALATQLAKLADTGYNDAQPMGAEPNDRAFRWKGLIELVGNAEAIRRLGQGDPPSTIVASWKKDIDAFRQMRSKYLIYP
jgi:uncharacterized protein YbbC (DUF1343 family)